MSPTPRAMRATAARASSPEPRDDKAPGLSRGSRVRLVVLSLTMLLMHYGGPCSHPRTRILGFAPLKYASSSASA